MDSTGAKTRDHPRRWKLEPGSLHHPLLPKFDVEKISQYRFRRQPRPYCLSTVEAAHLLIEHLHQLGLTALPAERAHDRMLETFDWIVESQLKFGSEELSKL